MNSQEDAATAQLADFVKQAGGLDAARRHALQELRLHTVVRVRFAPALEQAGSAKWPDENGLTSTSMQHR